MVFRGSAIAQPRGVRQRQTVCEEQHLPRRAQAPSFGPHHHNSQATSPLWVHHTVFRGREPAPATEEGWARELAQRVVGWSVFFPRFLLPRLKRNRAPLEADRETQRSDGW